jgi:protein-L-isoaspartate(D-aspartate) O-methyltransferase
MLHTLGLWHLWRGLVGESSEPHASAIAADDGLASIARAARTATLETSPALAGIAAPIRRALATVRRERYVLAEDVGHSADDHALSLVDDALEGATADEPATISAMHAYARAFAALELREGDSLVELGGGSGYGAAVARELVGPNGKVTTIEWSETLASRARALLPADVEVMQGDAHDVERWRGARKVYVAFALSTLPDAWIEALADGGALVAPIGSTDRQTLTLARKVDGRWTQTALESVRYVADRSPLAPPSPTPTEGSD